MIEIGGHTFLTDEDAMDFDPKELAQMAAAERATALGLVAAFWVRDPDGHERQIFLRVGDELTVDAGTEVILPPQP